MLKSRLPQIAIEIEMIGREIERDGADRVKETAQARVTRKTGKLHDAIHREPSEEGVYVVAGNDEVYYGHMVEHGTSHSAPRPFLVPALEENRDPIVREGREKLRRL